MLQLFRFCVDRLKGKPDCLSSAVYESRDGAEKILYLEQWKSTEDLNRHIHSNLYLGILNAIDLAIEPRGIRFCEVTDIKSMELVVAVRTSNKSLEA
jgi:quinol monooxygenase YgiN